MSAHSYRLWKSMYHLWCALLVLWYVLVTCLMLQILEGIAHNVPSACPPTQLWITFYLCVPVDNLGLYRARKVPSADSVAATLVNKHTPSFICTRMHNRALSSYSPTCTGVDHALLLWRSPRVVQDNARDCQPAYISPIWVPVILGWSSCHGTTVISTTVCMLFNIL